MISPKERAVQLYESLTTLKDKDGAFVIAIEENWRIVATFIIGEFLGDQYKDRSYIYHTDNSIVHTTYDAYYTQVLLEILKL
jgi:hypothetical protein